jgi:hypothetical protein
MRVKHLLEEGRKRLLQWLARRGISFSLAMAAVTLSRNASAGIHMADTLSLSQLAVAVIGGADVADTVRPEVATLFQQGVQAMLLSKLKVALAVVFTACLATIGAVGLASLTEAQVVPMELTKVEKLPSNVAQPRSPAPGDAATVAGTNPRPVQKNPATKILLKRREGRSFETLSKN